jgi:hypothetical protein
LEVLVDRDYNQGDQMSLRIKRPKCSPTHELSKLMLNRNCGKVAQKFGLLLSFSKTKLINAVY